MIILVADDNALSCELIRKLLEGSGQVGEVRIPADRCCDAAILATLLQSLGLVDLKKIDWVIVGGESGRGARPIEEVWVQSLLKQCTKQDVKFFFKQWGGVNKKATGRLLNGRTYDELPIIQ